MAGQLYQKVTRMHAKEATEDGTLETVLQGKVESVKAHKAGDYILVGTEGERYSMSAEMFKSRYDVAAAMEAADASLQAQGFRCYTPTGRAWAQQVDQATVSACFPAGKFIAPWGSEMMIAPGDWLATAAPSADEIYRIEKTAFANTYSPVADALSKGSSPRKRKR